MHAYGRNRGTSTPWGRSDYKKSYQRGVTFHGTPGHGGLHVAAGLAARIPEQARAAAAIRWKSGDWYEEDCAYLVPLLALPGLADSMGVDKAEASGQLIRWYGPDVARCLGVDPAEWPVSLARWEEDQTEKRMRAERHPDLITSAFGDWADWVPKGAVGVYTADGRRHLVTAESYGVRAGLNLLSRCAPFSGTLVGAE